MEINLKHLRLCRGWQSGSSARATSGSAQKIPEPTRLEARASVWLIDLSSQAYTKQLLPKIGSSLLSCLKQQPDALFEIRHLLGSIW